MTQEDLEESADVISQDHRTKKAPKKKKLSLINGM